MCLACLEYLEGRLSRKEYSRNRGEIDAKPGVEHDPKAEDKEIDELIDELFNPDLR